MFLFIPGVNLLPDPLGTLTANHIPPSAFNTPHQSYANATGGEAGYYTFLDWLLTSRPGLFGTVGGVANPTGVALVAVVTVITVCSMTWVRKGGYFEVRF